MFREILEDAVKDLYENTYAIGYVKCDTDYFGDNCFDFNDIYGKLPCLFLTYNKEKIHVYIRIPKVYHLDYQIKHFF